MQTGDILIGRRFTGKTAEMMMFEGGFANHAAMIIANDDSPIKYVIDCPSDMGLYNGEGGVRLLELGDWLDEAMEYDYEVAWLPLNKNLRTFGDLNYENLAQWIETVKNGTYSHVHHFFASIDTADQSFPAPLNSESFGINMRLFLKFKGYMPDLTGNKPGDIFLEALVNRLIWAIESGLMDDDEGSDVDAEKEEKSDDEKKKLRQQKADEIKKNNPTDLESTILIAAELGMSIS